MGMKNDKHCILYILLIASMIILGIVLHEASHALALLLFGGSIYEISLINSHVTGHVMASNIPYIAMAALVFPAILVFGLSFIKIKNKTVRKYFAFSLVYLAITPLINNLTNQFVFLFERNNSKHHACDLLLAIDYSNKYVEAFCIASSVISACLSAFVMLRQWRIFYDAVD